jgi:putative chitinase
MPEPNLPNLPTVQPAQPDAQFVTAAQTLTQRLTGPLKLNPPSAENLTKLLPLFLVDSAQWVDPRKFAYALTTAYHETGKVQQIGNQKLLVRFAPISETRANPQRQPGLYAQQRRYWSSGFYGRGLAQITWRDNYQKFADLLGIPLVEQPDLALQLPTAYQILREGMFRGLFTGKKLADYINGQTCDFINARRIINGTDRAAEIARVAQTVLQVFTT